MSVSPTVSCGKRAIRGEEFKVLTTSILGPFVYLNMYLNLSRLGDIGASQVVLV